MSPPLQHVENPYGILDLWEHNNENYQNNFYWTFMVPPLYDSLRPGRIVSICYGEEEKLGEVTQEEPEIDIIWDEELLVTSSKDVEDVTYEDPIERDMMIPSPYEANDEEWLNPFSTIIQYGTTPDFTDSCYIHTAHYDEKFEYLGPRISDDSSMMSLSYSSYNREACRTEDYFADIQHMISLGYHF